MITPALDARRCTWTGSTLGRGGGPAGRFPREPADLLEAEGVGPGPEQVTAVEVVDHEQVGLDPDPDPLATEDLRGDQDVSAEGDGPAVGDDPFDLDYVAGLDRRQRRRASVGRALGD